MLNLEPLSLESGIGLSDSGIREHIGLGIQSGNTKSTALRTESEIAYVERCMR